MSTPTFPSLLPIALRLEGRRCLVVGGGPVALSKVRSLRACGAEVAVVATVACEGLRSLADLDAAVELFERPYREGDVRGAWLVVAATGDPSVDGLVSDDAHRQQTFVNAVDDIEHASAYLTAVVRRDPVLVAISTSGASPAMASWLRRRLSSELEPEIGEVALVLAELRAELRAAGRSTEGLDWGPAIDDELFELVRRGDRAAALELLRSKVLGGGA